jgi:hypothetical protein
MNDSNNYGGTFSPYEDIDTPHNDDKGVLQGKDMTLDDYKNVVNPIDNYSPDRDDMMKDGLSDDNDMLGEGNDGEDYTLDDLDDIEFANTDISDITDIDSRKPSLNAAQLILDEKLNLVINGIRIIVDRLDSIEELIRNDDE